MIKSKILAIFRCWPKILATNISELMDFPTPQHDRIKVTVKQIYNESGTKFMESEVVGIEGIE